MSDPDFKVAIIGLGLIGGSLARDLAARHCRVLGYDHQPAALGAAHHAGVVDQAMSASLEEASGADVVVIATPVSATPAVLRALAAHLPADIPITDVGSTKAGALAAARAAGLEGQFVGSHPVAGDHRQGWVASREHLFVEAAVYLCPAAGTQPGAVTAVASLWRLVGARPLLATPAEHDQLLAWSSHLPQTVAFALAAALGRAGISRAALGPGGSDTLRLAASPPALWTGIALENAPALLEAIEGLKCELGEIERALKERDGPSLAQLFEAAQTWYTHRA